MDNAELEKRVACLTATLSYVLCMAKHENYDVIDQVLKNSLSLLKLPETSTTPTADAPLDIKEYPPGLGPTPAMKADPRFDAIWNTIKSWEIADPSSYYGYTSVTGNHVRAILEAIWAVDYLSTWRAASDGGLVDVIGEAALKSMAKAPDGTQLTVFRRRDSGVIYARPKDEFFDGRYIEEKPEGSTNNASSNDISKSSGDSKIMQGVAHELRKTVLKNRTLLTEEHQPIATAPRDGTIIRVMHEDVGEFLMRWGVVQAPGEMTFSTAWSTPDFSVQWSEDQGCGPSRWRPADIKDNA